MLIRRILFLPAFFCVSLAAGGAENKYEIFGKALTPFVHLLAKNSTTPNRAVRLTLRIESATDLSTEWIGAHADIALQHPDKLRLRGPVSGEDLTVCRNGQEVWVFPGSKAEALFSATSGDRKLPVPDKKYRLEPFRLPVPEKQLVLFPALFQISDRGEERLNETRCRVLDLKLMPELARSLEVMEWAAQLWVNAEYKPVRLRLERPGWQITILIDALQFLPSLPELTWEPSAEQVGDVMKISPARYKQLLNSIGGARRK